MIKSINMIQVGHVTRMRRREVHKRVLVGKPERNKGHLEGLVVDGRIIRIKVDH